jgi:hypothetical protein
VSKRKSDSRVAGSPARPEVICTLVVDNTFDKFEVEICCRRTDGVDRAFATDKDLAGLRAERPNESTLAHSAETLLFHIIWSCLYYVGEPVNVRAGFLDKEHVEAIISSVRLEMDEIKKANEAWREAEIVSKAAQWGLSPDASKLDVGTWIARCPGTNHTLQMQPKQNLFYCGYCRVGGGMVELYEFAAPEKRIHLAEEPELTN